MVSDCVQLTCVGNSKVRQSNLYFQLNGDCEVKIGHVGCYLVGLGRVLLSKVGFSNFQLNLGGFR
jgi:hypothetical protein